MSIFIGLWYHYCSKIDLLGVMKAAWEAIRLLILDVDNDESASETSFNDIANSAGITFPTPLPVQAPPNREQLQEWANSQLTPVVRRIAHKVIDNIQYIDFETFKEQLKRTVTDFHHAVPQAPYVLVIAEDRGWKLREGCSDLWVAGLAFEYANLRCPQAIVTLPHIKQYLQQHPDIKHLLILDDASFSGQQKYERLSDYRHHLCSGGSPTVYLGILYVSQYAKDRLRQLGSQIPMIFLNHTHMPVSIDGFNEEEKKFIHAFRMNLKDSQTLTYFDHRYPDFMSTNSNLQDGSMLISAVCIHEIMRYLGYQTASDKKDADLTALSPNDWNKMVTAIFPNYNQRVRGNMIPIIVPPYYQKTEPKDAVTPWQFKPTSLPLTVQLALDEAVKRETWKTERYAGNPFHKFQLLPPPLEARLSDEPNTDALTFKK
jgi:hypothetical protein